MPASFVPPLCRTKHQEEILICTGCPGACVCQWRGVPVCAPGPAAPRGAGMGRSWAGLELCLQASSLLPPSVAAELTAA